MERTMLGIIIVRRRTKMYDFGDRAIHLKWSWARHLARLGDGRWSKAITEWWPRSGQRSLGRPKSRWVHDIVRVAGNNKT